MNNNQKKCIFYKIINKSLPTDILYEDNQVLVILDVDWVIKGHTLIIWKPHKNNASDLTKTEFIHFSKVFHKIEKALLDILQQDRSIILKTGGLIPHFHFHIYPVSSQTTWKQIKNMFDKKIKYRPKPNEAEKLTNELKIKLI